MTMRYLTRINPAANMARYYKLDVLPDLFGSFSLIREFGRIGRAGRVLMTAYETASDAEQACDRQFSAKLNRGYAASRFNAKLLSVAPSECPADE